MAVPLGYHYTRHASRDLERIADYLRSQSGESIALRFLDSVDHTVDLLRSTPYLGTACHFTSRRQVSTRRIAVSGPFDRWVIFYTPAKADIRIDRIFHSAQDIPLRLR